MGPRCGTTRRCTYTRVTACGHMDACTAGCACGHAGTRVCRAVGLRNHVTKQHTHVCPRRHGRENMYVSTCGHIWQSPTCMHAGGRAQAGGGSGTWQWTPPASYQQLRVPNPLFFPQENCTARGSPQAPHHALQVQEKDEHPAPRVSWVISLVQPCPMCVTPQEDQVNHFGWQVEGEETAATGWPRGGDSAPLCLCHPGTA